MPTLARALVDYDLDLLQVIASQWDVDLVSTDRAVAAEELSVAVIRANAVAEMWSHLPDQERSALYDLQGHEGRIPFAHFIRRYGELRPMGPARREREKPWLNPASITEALYYRGMIVRAFEQTPAGAQEHIVIPSDIHELLPPPGPDAIQTAPGYPVARPRRVEGGQGAAADDAATLLAYLLVRDTDARDWLVREAIPAIDRHLRRPDQPPYRVMLTSLLYDLDLILNEEFLTQVLARVNKDMSRPWLEAPRLHQLRALAEAWRVSATWNDLMHTPGLEADHWPNDPLLARQVILETLHDVPAGIWWSADSFIEHIKQTRPDYQRPGGDYAAWYLRDAYTGEILHGFQYWDYIEGAQLRFILEGPMRWLGLVRSASGAFMVTPLGYALAGLEDWPSQPDPAPSISIDEQGVISVPAAMERYERVQIARFASWVSPPPIPKESPERETSADEGTYLYRITPQALARVIDDKISIASHIVPFLQRVSSHRIPANVLKMLEAWHNRPGEVVVQDIVTITARDLGVYERLRTNPRIGKWLERQVGPQSYAVRRENVSALIAALRNVGILPLFEDHEKDDWP
jgi:hypothetical protein